MNFSPLPTVGVNVKIHLCSLVFYCWHTRFQNGIVLCSSLCRSQTVSPDRRADKAEEVQEWSEPPFDRTQVVQASSCHWVNDALRAVKHL